MTTKYKKGYRFEDAVRKKLEKEGYYVVRSSGSKGVFDLIAFPPLPAELCMRSPPMGIQCKAHGKLTKAEKDKLIIIAKNYGIQPFLATKFNKHIILIDLKDNKTIPL